MHERLDNSSTFTSSGGSGWTTTTSYSLPATGPAYALGNYTAEQAGSILGSDAYLSASTTARALGATHAEPATETFAARSARFQGRDEDEDEQDQPEGDGGEEDEGAGNGSNAGGGSGGGRWGLLINAVAQFAQGQAPVHQETLRRSTSILNQPRCISCHNPIIMGGGGFNDVPEDFQLSILAFTRTRSARDADAAIGRMREAASTALRVAAEVAVGVATAPLLGPLAGVRYVGWAFRTPILRSALWGAGTDATTQGILLAAGSQRQYSIQQTGWAAALGGALEAGARLWRWVCGPRPPASAPASGGPGPVAVGQQGLQAAGITQNTTRIPSLAGTAAYRVPDGLNHTTRVISEVKNVSSLSYRVPSLHSLTLCGDSENIALGRPITCRWNDARLRARCQIALVNSLPYAA